MKRLELLVVIISVCMITGRLVAGKIADNIATYIEYPASKITE